MSVVEFGLSQVPPRKAKVSFDPERSIDFEGECTIGFADGVLCVQYADGTNEKLDPKRVERECYDLLAQSIVELVFPKGASVGAPDGVPPPRRREELIADAQRLAAEDHSTAIRELQASLAKLRNEQASLAGATAPIGQAPQAASSVPGAPPVPAPQAASSVPEAPPVPAPRAPRVAALATRWKTIVVSRGGYLGIISLLVLVCVDTFQSVELINKVVNKIEGDNSELYTSLKNYAPTDDPLILTLLLKLVVTAILLISSALYPPLKRFPLVFILSLGKSTNDGETTEMWNSLVTLTATTIICVSMQLIGETDSEYFNDDVQRVVRKLAPVTTIARIAYRGSPMKQLKECMEKLPVCVAGKKYEYVKLADLVVFSSDNSINLSKTAEVMMLSLLACGTACARAGITVRDAVFEFARTGGLGPAGKQLLGSQLIVASIIFAVRDWERPGTRAALSIATAMDAHSSPSLVKLNVAVPLYRKVFDKYVEFVEWEKQARKFD